MNHGVRGVAAAALLLATACHAAVRPPSPPASPAPPALVSLRLDIDAILDDPVLERGTWGVLVKSLKTGDTIYARNDRKLLMPASTMKIVTVAAAAARLGWDFTYETRLAVAGRIENGVLDGDLVVVGSGDPGIGSIDGSADRLFSEWAGRLKEMGVRSISGRVVGDDNAFDDDELGFGWSWDDLADDYAAGVSALQFNENAVHVSIAPGPSAGDSAAVTVEPPASGIAVVSRVRTGAGGATTSVRARRLPGSQQLALDGTVAAGAAPSRLTVSVDNPTLFFVESLRRALIGQGIDVKGPAVDVDALSDPPASPRVVAAHRSPPLSTLAVRLMKVSQNQYAETFVKTLGASAGRPGTIAGGETIEMEIFNAWGIPGSDFILRDGSGLSRYDYVTAGALVAILSHVQADDRLRGAFEASLPVAGQDGTLTTRMSGLPAGATVRAKTGSMSNVRALSGYLDTAAGEPLAFAIIANNFETTADIINRATDAILGRLALLRPR